MVSSIFPCVPAAPGCGLGQSKDDIYLWWFSHLLSPRAAASRNTRSSIIRMVVGAKGPWRHSSHLQGFRDEKRSGRGPWAQAKLLDCRPACRWPLVNSVLSELAFHLGTILHGGILVLFLMRKPRLRGEARLSSQEGQRSLRSGYLVPSQCSFYLAVLPLQMET